MCSSSHNVQHYFVLLRHIFGSATEGIYFHTGSDGKFFKLSRLRAKTKVQITCLRDLLFANDAAVTRHSAEDLQQLNCFSKVCQEFGLTIRLKKTQVMGLDVNSPPSTLISNYKLEVVHDFVCLYHLSLTHSLLTLR